MTYFTGFFAFMLGMWTLLPTAIVSMIVGCVSLFLLFGIFKMLIR